MKKIAVFPGSFDPFTKGHENVIEKAINLFDEIIIALGINTSKKYLFSTEKRVQHIQAIYQNYPTISVEHYSGLTTDFCKEKKANYIIRGLRNTTDFEFEKPIAIINHQLSGVETILFYTEPEVSAISSTIIREIYKVNGNITPFVSQLDVLLDLENLPF